MEAAYKHLVRKEEGLIQLFEPPFDKGTMNPGYIKGYVPGVRENGGQYTHAAIWLIMGFAALGNRQRTWELLHMINPLNHARDAATIAQYKVEPYVMAADVYAESLHKGRGGWTWYTGSAGWMYQLITESFIGLKKEGDRLYFKPCLPAEWPWVKITYRHNETFYAITLNNNENGSTKIMVDGLEKDFVQLIDDGGRHEVKVGGEEVAKV